MVLLYQPAARANIPQQYLPFFVYFYLSFRLSHLKMQRREEKTGVNVRTFWHSRLSISRGCFITSACWEQTTTSELSNLSEDILLFIFCERWRRKGRRGIFFNNIRHSRSSTHFFEDSGEYIRSSTLWGSVDIRERENDVMAKIQRQMTLEPLVLEFSVDIPYSLFRRDAVFLHTIFSHQSSIDWQCLEECPRIRFLPCLSVKHDSVCLVPCGQSRKALSHPVSLLNRERMMMILSLLPRLLKRDQTISPLSLSSKGSKILSRSIDWREEREKSSERRESLSLS